jgi:rubrerythrin
MATGDNLKAAFAGESQANRMYLAFAKKAAADGWHQVAKLFRAAAAAETVHAHAHFRVMGGIRSTEDNLAAAIAGEGHEFKEMYPRFIDEATAENNRAAQVSFRNAMAVEQIHHGLYAGALDAVKAGRDLPAADIYVCDICGNTVVGEPPDVCPICGAKHDRFTKVE